MSDSAPVDKDVESAESEADKWKAQLVLYQNAVRDLKAHSAKQKEALFDARESAARQKASLQEELKKKDLELQQAVRVKEKLAEQVSQLSQARTEEAKLFKEKLEMLAERLKASESHRRELKQQLEDGDGQSETLSKTVQELKKRVASLESELENNADTHRFVVAKLQADLEKCQAKEKE